MYIFSARYSEGSLLSVLSVSDIIYDIPSMDEVKGVRSWGVSINPGILIGLFWIIPEPG